MRFNYGITLAASTQDSEGDEGLSKKEVQNLVNTTLGLLTAGCEQCVYSQRLFCEKLMRPVKVRGTRCEFFSRRPTAYPQDLI
jgi:hypothetical protein